MMEYTEENLEIVSNIIMKCLTQDLLPKKYRVRNSFNPTFGHCHTASGCLYKIFGPKAMHMYRALDDEGIWHWWIIDKNNKLIDLTAEQYTSEGRIPPYNKGNKASMLGFSYAKRVRELYNRVMENMNECIVGRT